MFSSVAMLIKNTIDFMESGSNVLNISSIVVSKEVLNFLVFQLTAQVKEH